MQKCNKTTSVSEDKRESDEQGYSIDYVTDLTRRMELTMLPYTKYGYMCKLFGKVDDDIIKDAKEFEERMKNRRD